MSDTSLGRNDSPADPPTVDAVDGYMPETAETPAGEFPTAHEPESSQGMIPGRSRRRTKLERASMRILATGGIIGIATALGAVLVNENVAGWVVGLAVGLTSVILAAVLWSSRQL